VILSSYFRRARRAHLVIWANLPHGPVNKTVLIFAAWCYASAALAVMQCLSVRLSCSYILSKRINISLKKIAIG